MRLSPAAAAIDGGAGSVMDGLLVARAVHVLAVVVWIGGVAMATSAVIPAARRGELGADRVQAFRAIERRFVWQARMAVLLVGLSGIYMTAELDLWDRFGMAAFWWMHAMVGTWLLFAVLLFLVEPVILHRSIDRWAETAPDTAFAWLQRGHIVLLTLGSVTILGAAAGSHGWFPF